MTDRRFARLRRSSSEGRAGIWEVPDDGMCLSAFLVLEAPGRDGEVLMGKLNPEAPWAELGALDPTRVETIATRWMLPSSQLVFFEPPEDAARRILAEQLGSNPIPLSGPQVFTDTTGRRTSEGRDPHWDFHFVFRGRWPSPTPPQASAWRTLEFVRVAHLRRSEIARDQGDVLEFVGLRSAD